MLGMDMRWYEGVLKWVTPLKPKPMVKVKPYGVLLLGNTHQDRGSKWGTHGEWTHSLALRSFSPSLGARVRPIRYDATAVNTWSRQPVFKDLIMVHHDVFFFGVSWEASTTRIYGGACQRPAKVGETPLYHWSELGWTQIFHASNWWGTGEVLVRKSPVIWVLDSFEVWCYPFGFIWAIHNSAIWSIKQSPSSIPPHFSRVPQMDIFPAEWHPKRHPNRPRWSNRSPRADSLRRTARPCWDKKPINFWLRISQNTVHSKSYLGAQRCPKVGCTQKWNKEMKQTTVFNWTAAVCWTCRPQDRGRVPFGWRESLPRSVTRPSSCNEAGDAHMTNV
jgi:hypothetical protein